MDSNATSSLSQLGRETRQRASHIRPTLEEWEKPFEHHPLLDPLGYVWHPGIQLLICKICNTAVSPSNAGGHSDKTPGHTFVNKAARKTIHEMAKDCEFEEREGRLPQVGKGGGLTPLAEFETTTGYQCPACDRISHDPDSIRRHFNKAHGSRTGVTFAKVRAQFLFKGRYGVMFALNIRDTPARIEDFPCSFEIGEALQMEIAQALHDEHSADWTAKDTWKYLQDVPWHTVLESNHDRYTVADLKTFVTIPRIHTSDAAGTLARSLAIAVEALFLGVEGDIRGADYRLRQWLGSDTEV